MKKPEISKIAVSWWTRFIGSKSVVVSIKIYTFNEILLNDYVKSEYIYWDLLRVYIEYNI